MAIQFAGGTYMGLIRAHGLTESDYGQQAWVEFSVCEKGADGQFHDTEVIRTAYLRLTDENGDEAFTQDGSKNLTDQALDVLAYLGCTDLTAFECEGDDDNKTGVAVGKEVSTFCKVKQKDDGSEVESWYINTPRKAKAKLEAAAVKKIGSLFNKKLAEKLKASAPAAKS